MTEKSPSSVSSYCPQPEIATPVGCDVLKQSDCTGPVVEINSAQAFSSSSAAGCILLSVALTTPYSPTNTTNDNNHYRNKVQNQLAGITDVLQKADKVQELYLFRPDYTHQCFPGETIPGYRPKLSISVLDDTNKDLRHVPLAVSPTRELEILIALAPSCQFCTIEVKVDGVLVSNINEMQGDLLSQGIQEMTYKSYKRRKLLRGQSPGYDDEDSIELGSADSEDDDDDTEEDVDVMRPFSLRDIVARLRMALPPILNEITDEARYLLKPIGTVLKEYCIEGNSSSSKLEFVLTVAEGSECATYHTNIQGLALFFIETADHIDLCSNDRDGRNWKVLYLFRKHYNDTMIRGRKDPMGNPEPTLQCSFSLVGYMTLYHFYNPFRKPVPGTILRICQALILPPYQRFGHGRKMLHCIYDIQPIKTNTSCSGSATHSTLCIDDIVEVNVEDPAPGFVAMRDLVDYERFILLGKMWFACLNQTSGAGSGSGLSSTDGDDSCHLNKGNSKYILVTDASFFRPLTTTDAVKVTVHSRTTTQQVHIVYELDKLHMLRMYISESNSLTCADIDDLNKRYRLMVKQRLNKCFNAEMLACRTKQERQDWLTNKFNEVYTAYESILERVHRRNLTSNSPGQH